MATSDPVKRIVSGGEDSTVKVWDISPLDTSK
jgi:WD40 repeat protein